MESTQGRFWGFGQRWALFVHVYREVNQEADIMAKGCIWIQMLSSNILLLISNRGKNVSYIVLVAFLLFHSLF